VTTGQKQAAIIAGALCAVVGILMPWHPPDDKAFYGGYVVMLAMARVAVFPEKWTQEEPPASREASRRLTSASYFSPIRLTNYGR
jgi:hypothetical protein